MENTQPAISYMKYGSLHQMKGKETFDSVNL